MKPFALAAAAAVLLALPLASPLPGASADEAGKEQPGEGSDPWGSHRGKLRFLLGYEAGMASVRDTGKPPMYFFTTTWCGWCKKLAGESFNDDEVLKVLEKFTPIIVDGDTEKETCSKYGVNGYPRVVFADAKGEAVLSVNGYKPRDQFLATAQDAARKIRPGKPSKEFKALLDAKEDLDKALEKKNAKTALSAIAKIEKIRKEGEIPAAAKAAKEKLVAEGRERLAAAKKTSDDGDVEGARKAARALASEYSGTPVADEANAFLKSLPEPEPAK